IDAGGRGKRTGGYRAGSGREGRVTRPSRIRAKTWQSHGDATYLGLTRWSPWPMQRAWGAAPFGCATDLKGEHP
ncbi:hypothetical protein EY01_15650, partial [Staphylococcus aureus]